MAGTATKDVLIVDDDDAIRNLICTVLTRCGMACDTAPDGVRALDFIAVTHYAVVLLDLMMPRLDGAEMLARVRTLGLFDFHRPIVIVLTACPERNALQAVDEMAQVVIRKPFDLHQLRELVEDCVAAHPRTSLCAPWPGRQPQL